MTAGTLLVKYWLLRVSCACRTAAGTAISGLITFKLCSRPK
jgi:hypothetical protein